MPVYTIQAPDGRSFDLEGDSPPSEQELEQVFSSLPKATGQLKPSTQELLGEEKLARQQIISEAQRPGLSKAIQGAIGLGGAIASPFISVAEGIGGIPDVIAEPSRILPTVGEAGKRLGIDLVQLGEMMRPKTVTQAALGPAGSLGAALIKGIGNLRSYTPTEQQIQEQLLARQEKLPFQQSVQEERNKVAFEGAQPALAEGINQAIQITAPVGEAASLIKAGGTGAASIPRMIRSAIKPTKAALGAKIEKAAAEEISDIFHANPSADKIAATPIEGFASEVKTAFSKAGEEISNLRAQSGTVLNAGDQLADKIIEKAIALEKAGQPKAIIDEMVSRAEDIRGQMSDINSLQDAVTISNRKPNIMKPKSNAEGFVDEIIAKEGGTLINQELESIGGPAGATARKKWSNLKVLSENVDERVNKIINSAPPEAQGALINTLASPEGIAGLFAMVHGWALPGSVALGSKLIKNWAKNEVKSLKDSNSIIERTYESLRKNPPPKNP